MPELSELDRRILRQDSTRRARAQVAGMLPLITPKIAAVKNLAPSYVAAAIQGMLDAMTRWEADERVALESPHA